MCAAITAAVPGAPVRYKDERNLVFRGEHIQIHQGKASSIKINFQFDSPENLLKGLRDSGLRLKDWETDKILSKYYMATL